jgi:hypothetical protein
MSKDDEERARKIMALYYAPSRCFHGVECAGDEKHFCSECATLATSLGLCSEGACFIKEVQPRIAKVRTRKASKAAPKPYPEDHWVISFGLRFLAGLENISGLPGKPKVEQIQRLSLPCENPWTAMRRLRIDAEELRRAVEYTDPFTGYTFWWMLPVEVLTDDVAKYRHPYIHTSFEDMLFDPGFLADMGQPIVPRQYEISRVMDTMLGPGYDKGRSPDDGSVGSGLGLVSLDNGDWLLVYTLEWYNK